MSNKLEGEAEKMMVEIVQDLEEKERRINKLKKIKEDVNEILNLGDIPDEQLFEKISP